MRVQKNYYAVGSYVLPLAFCICLLLSGFRLYWEKNQMRNLPQPKDPGCGIVYRAVWNKERQLTFIGKEVRVLLYCEEPLYRELKNGCYIQWNNSDSVLRIPESATNPGEFDRRNYLAGKKLDYIAYVKPDYVFCQDAASVPFSLRVLLFPRRLSAFLRNEISAALHGSLGSRYAAAVMAILTGETGGLDTEELGRYRDAGISHIMAVSGMHVAFVQKITGRLLARKRLGFRARNLLGILFLLLFACIADFSPSVMRAVLQSTYILLAKAFRKPCQKYNAFCVSALVQLLPNPFLLYHSGFLLSYGAAASILWLKPALAKRFLFLRKLPDSLLTGMAVNLGILPLMISFFNSVSPIGLLATVFASRIASAVCASGLAVWLLHAVPIAKALCRVPAALSAAAVWLLEKISRVGSGIPPPFGAFSVPSWKGIVVFLYYAMIVVVLSRKAMCILRKKLLPFFLCCGVAGLSLQYRSNRTEILFFDVGQGFSALVRTRQVCGLVDGGDGTKDISALLYKQGIRKLDFVILTHGHQDHAAGIYEVLREHPVRCLFIPDNPHDLGAAALAEYAGTFGTEIIGIRGCTEYRVGDLCVRLCTNENAMNSEESASVNNASVIALLENENGSVLFTGDIERESEEYFIGKNCITETDVLAVAHHGSDGGSLNKNISIISPEYAIISVGKNNRYGHPSPRVTEALEAAGAEVFRSDLCGAVRITMRKGTRYACRKRKISNISKIISAGKI